MADGVRQRGRRDLEPIGRPMSPSDKLGTGKVLKTMDVFTKIPDDFKVRTTRGGLGETIHEIP
jgi:hypothetical protein